MTDNLTPETLRAKAVRIRGAYSGRYMLDLADALDAYADAWEKDIAARKDAEHRVEVVTSYANMGVAVERRLEERLADAERTINDMGGGRSNFPTMQRLRAEKLDLERRLADAEKRLAAWREYGKAEMSFTSQDSRDWLPAERYAAVAALRELEEDV